MKLIPNMMTVHRLYESKYEEGYNGHEYQDENNYNYSADYANEEMDGQYDYGNGEATESVHYESNATTDDGAWEESYAYNADEDILMKTMKPPLQ